MNTSKSTSEKPAPGFHVERSIDDEYPGYQTNDKRNEYGGEMRTYRTKAAAIRATHIFAALNAALNAREAHDREWATDREDDEL